jgi:mono/diheme cytochrome c family protein
VKRALFLCASLLGCRPQSLAPIPESHEAIAIEPVFPVANEASAVVLATLAGRRVAFVADEDESAIHTLDLETQKAVARTEVSGRPAKMMLSRGGLLVLRRDAASIAMFVAVDRARPLRATFELATSEEPTALARAPGNDDTVWVTTGWSRRLESFDLRSHEKKSSLALLREPRALLIAQSGAQAIVGYMAESGFGLVDLDERTAGFLPVETTAMSFKCSGKTKGCPGSRPARFARQTFALARLSKGGMETVVAPYTMVASGKPEANTGGYGASESVAPNAFDVATLDFTTKVRFTASHHDRSCALPRAAIVDPVSQRAYVACLGSDHVVEIADRHDDDDDFFDGSRMRAAVAGGPIALAIDGGRRELWVLRAFDRKLERLFVGEAGSFAKAASIKIELGRDEISLPHVEGLGLAPSIAAGRRLFHAADDGRISADGRACASCHPDGRDDGVVWPTPDGPRQTMFLAGRIDRTTPYGWSAAHATLAAHVRTTMHNIKGSGLDDASLADLASYLRAMPGPPHREHALTEVEARGRELFEAKDCGGCHGDGTSHDVGSKAKGDSKWAFAAPPLHLVAESAPYFHDGRFPTLGALLRGSESMAKTKDLSGEDLSALEAYLRTL